MRALGTTIIVVLVLCAGCGRREKSAEPDSIGAVVPGDAPNQAIEAELEEWVAMWRSAIPGFTMDSLQTGVRRKWQPESVQSLGEGLTHKYDDGDLTFRILGVHSPDGRRILDIDSYQEIYSAEGNVNVGGEPDSRSVLLDREARTETVLWSSGTLAGAHWGHWLSPDRFALAGWQEDWQDAQRRQGWLLVYDLRDSTVTDYETRWVTTADFERYSTAWGTIPAPDGKVVWAEINLGTSPRP